MSNKIWPPPPSNNPYEYLKIHHNPNDTLTRNLVDPHTSPSSNTTLPINVLTKDLTINQSHQTWLRLFLPKNSTNPNQNNKLPLIIFFHGGGFILLSAASTIFHDFCVELADTVEAVVASVEYRLAPEHRLPAAYDDAMEALTFIKSSEDEWLQNYVDFSTCYLMGNSAGATIAYNAGPMCNLKKVNDFEPLKIQGLILSQPFFGGTQRSESELRLENDPVLPLSVGDLMWELALPIGVDRDHKYGNLTAENDLDEKFDKIKDQGWRVLVSGNGGDPLVDRYKELVELMEKKGVEIVKDFEEEGFHGIEFFEPSKAKKLIGLVKGFISSFVV
uniref:Carboxylesterase 1-like n=1 Tax=Cicer arietinum TaxID=3827 RepID=Q6KAW1_CICAR|nr:putative esterase [Cicer arietinum]